MSKLISAAATGLPSCRALIASVAADGGLAALPATAAVIAAGPVPAQSAHPDALVISAVRRQIEAEDAFNRHPSNDDDHPEVMRLESIMHEQFVVASRTPATTIDGIKAKALLVKRRYASGEDPHAPHRSLDQEGLLVWGLASEILGLLKTDA